MLNNTYHNIAEYINDDFNLANTEQPSEQSCLSAYRRYFEGVEAGAAQLVIFSQQQQIKYRVGFISKFVWRPQAILKEVNRGGAVAIYDVMQGPFKLELRVLIVPETAPKWRQIGGGSFGKICQVEGRKGSVSKRFELIKKEKIIYQQNTNSFIPTHSPDDVKDAVLQCSLAKICSMLGIGPEYHLLMGFDLILFDDCIEFYMEKCSKYDFWPNEHSFDQIKLSLKKRVRAMHMICFTHKDIKPENILYSPTKEELVLCDFGISKFLSQKLGWKSLTFSQGTKSYMSDEMKSLSKRRPGWVDMYFNDMFALRKTISQIAKCPVNDSFQQKLDDKQFPGQLETVAITCYKLTEGQQIQFIPKSNRYSIALSEYFPEFSGNSFESIPVNPMLLVQYADISSELPYYLQLCDSSNKLVDDITQSIEKSFMSRMDLCYFRDANNNSFSNQRMRKSKIFQREAAIFDKNKPTKREDIIHYAEVLYQLLNIKVENPLLAARCKDIASKIEKLLEQNPNLETIQEIIHCSHLLLLTMTDASVGKYGNLVQKKKYSEQFILRVCEIIVNRTIFSIGDFKVMQMLLSFVKKQVMNACILKAQAYFMLGRIQKAVELLQAQLKANPLPKGNFYRLFAVCVLIKYLRKIDIIKAFELCKQQLETISAKYCHKVQLMMVDIYKQLGRDEQSLGLLENVIQYMSLSRGDEYLLGVYQLKLAQKLLLMNQYNKFIEVLRNLKDKPSYPTALFLEGKYHEFLGNFHQSIELYQQSLHSKYLMSGKESINCQLGILSSLTSEAVSRTDEHRLPHLQNALAQSKLLFVHMFKSMARSQKKYTKFYFITACLRFIIRCAYELKLQEEITESINKLNQILRNALEIAQLDLTGLIEQLLLILKVCPEVNMLETLDIFLGGLEAREKTLKQIFVDARQLLSICYLKSNRSDKAIYIFNPLHNPVNQKYVKNFNFIRSGKEFLGHKYYQEALNILSLGITPQLPGTSFWLALSYFQLDDREKSEFYIFNFLGSPKETQKDKIEWGAQCSSMLSKFHSKDKCFLKTHHTLQPQIFQNCGLYLLKQKKFAEALPWLKKTLLHQIKSRIILTPPLFIDLAVCNIEAKNEKASLRFFQQSLKLSEKPTHKQFLYLIKLCCQRLGFRAIYKQLSHYEHKSALSLLCRIMKQKKLYIHRKVLSEALKSRSEYNSTKAIKKRQYIVKSVRSMEMIREVITLKKLKLNCLRLKKKFFDLIRMLSQVNQCLKDLNLAMKKLSRD